MEILVAPLALILWTIAIAVITIVGLVAVITIVPIIFGLYLIVKEEIIKRRTRL